MSDALVVVDPQNDFCDSRGSLYVGGAEADIGRLSRYIEKKGGEIGAVFVSLDSHDEAAIFHPVFWTGGDGERPTPYTPISPTDFKTAKWKPAAPENGPFAARTFAALEARGESLMVWPEHCVVSTWGHQIAPKLLEALRGWREKTGLAVRYVFKGENPYTDQFSIFEGLDASYGETAFNETLFARLSAFDRVTFAGEALTHCVKESILSYVKRLGGKKQDVRLLADCASPVGGFDGEAAVEALRGAGVSVASSNGE
ncbi:MAG: isochorismatase family protein [Synergistaceae bacterium]|jgi:nicotinamidase-related amidase|nr:isochorismatase family protein [Synergistaceae bacterium]